MNRSAWDIGKPGTTTRCGGAVTTIDGGAGSDTLVLAASGEERDEWLG